MWSNCDRGDFSFCFETIMGAFVQVAARKRGFEEVEEEEQERGEVKSDVGEDDFSNYNENDNLQE